MSVIDDIIYGPVRTAITTVTLAISESLYVELYKKPAMPNACQIGEEWLEKNLANADSNGHVRIDAASLDDLYIGLVMTANNLHDEAMGVIAFIVGRLYRDYKLFFHRV